ncbi:MAG: hypothetical protein HQL78_08225 [Magnetococcales bacterium]|nr:hypothetical protein [Magnetococcales bacterium]
MTSNDTQKKWLSGLTDTIGEFMATLTIPGPAGRFKPCIKGACGAGTKAALGFSCFAHKIYYSLGLWPRLPPRDQQEWLTFIQSFQDAHGNPPNAFIDTALIEEIPPPPPLGVQLTLARMLSGVKAPRPREDAIRAETKQAIATLAQVGAKPWRPFLNFPRTPWTLRRTLKGLNWQSPWSAGAQTAGLAVLLQTQAPDSILVKTIGSFLDSVVDPVSGTYYRGNKAPERGQMINGAMKVLNALDWLEWAIHYPQRLIDTTLSQGPPPAGCHVVDWIYVVHRCGMATDHRRREIQEQCLHIIDLIQTHQNRDRGFSYQPHQAQTSYYGATISQGLHEGDIHGTCLLVWALTMIADIMEWELPGWRVIRP